MLATFCIEQHHELLFSDGLTATDASWIGMAPAGLTKGLRCTAKVRYRQPDQDCVVRDLGGGVVDVRFDDSQRAVAPGHFVVFYDGDRCLGGATIDLLG